MARSQAFRGGGETLSDTPGPGTAVPDPVMARAALAYLDGAISAKRRLRKREPAMP